MSETFSATQQQILAAAEVLWRSQLIKPEADPTGVMVAIAHMLRAAYHNRPMTDLQAKDIDPQLKKRIISG